MFEPPTEGGVEILRVLIVNSDDFGYNSDVNQAILTTFQRGLCSSTTIMPNMPGFEEAAEWAHEQKLLEKVGMHLVLVEGRPLTAKIRRCPRFCDSNGLFHKQGKRILKLSTSEREAVAAEICAQIDRCRQSRLPLTHLDSHHHIHHAWGLSGVLLDVVAEKKIPFVRIRSFTGATSMAKRASTLLYNAKLRISGVAGTEYFGDIHAFLRLKQKLNSGRPLRSFEIMIHPVFDKNGELIDAMDKQPLDRWVTQVDGYRSAISYGQIKSRKRMGAWIYRLACKAG